jgi:hypothetical protein
MVMVERSSVSVVKPTKSGRHDGAPDSVTTDGCIALTFCFLVQDKSCCFTRAEQKVLGNVLGMCLSENILFF